MCLRHWCCVLRYVPYHCQDLYFKRKQLCTVYCFEFPRMAKLADMQTNLILPGTTVLFLVLKGYSLKELNHKRKDYSLLDNTCLVWKQMGNCLPAVNQSIQTNKLLKSQRDLNFSNSLLILVIQPSSQILLNAQNIVSSLIFIF